MNRHEKKLMWAGLLALCLLVWLIAILAVVESVDGRGWGKVRVSSSTAYCSGQQTAIGMRARLGVRFDLIEAAEWLSDPTAGRRD